MTGGFVFGDVNARLSTDTYPDTGTLFVDDFTDGFNGWTELYESGTNTPRPALSRVTFPAMSGGYALRIGTGAVDITKKDGFGEAIKRLTRIKDTGIVNFDLWWSYGSVGSPNAPGSIDFGFDTQKRDGTTRSTPHFRWAIVNAPVDGTIVNKWQIMNNAGAVVDVPGAVYIHPFNENKQNYIYSRFRFDLTSGYKTLQVYDDVYDVSGLGGGTGNQSTVTGFNNGLNFYVAIYNRTSAVLTQAWVDLDRCRGWYE